MSNGNFFGRSGYHDTFEKLVQEEKKWMEEECTPESIYREFSELPETLKMNLQSSGSSMKNKKLLILVQVLIVEMILQIEKINKE